MGAGLVAILVYMLGDMLAGRLFTPRSSERVNTMLGTTAVKKRVAATDYGSPEHKIRLVFSQYKIDVSEKETLALNIARLAIGVLLSLMLYFGLGLRPIASIIGSFAGIIIANSLADNAWTRMCQQVEKEIPVFLSGFNSTIQVNPNVLQAVEEESAVLDMNSPLQTWLRDRFVRLGQEQGTSAIDFLVEEAFRITSSLGVMVFLMGRLWRTGGMEWKRSFTLAANNLEGVMEARMLGISAGNSAKGAVKVIIMVTMVVVVVLARNPIFASAMNSMIVQIVYAVVTWMMIFGYGMMSNMIDSMM